MGYGMMLRRILPLAFLGTGTLMKLSRRKEEKLPIIPQYNLKKGETYLIFEKGHNIGLDILFNALKASQGIDYGLCFTRENPERIRKKYDLINTNFVWLTRRRGDRNIPPDALNRIAAVVREFVKGGGIIYIDGIEYLISNNDFLAVKSLLDHLSDMVAISGAILVYSVDPDILDDKEKALLERFASIISI